MSSKSKHPLVVMPVVYELPLFLWRWCRIGEICAIIPAIAEMTEMEFSPTPEVLVSKFASLVRPNRIPDRFTPAERAKKPKVKVFRYSLDGESLRGKDVPTTGTTQDPPYVDFRLEIDGPYPPEMFVPEGWVLDVLRAIRRGAISAVDIGDMKLGFRPKDKYPGTVSLDDDSHELRIVTYGLEHHMKNYGNGENKLRTERAAQPRVLRVGDRYATGEYVSTKVEDGLSGSMSILLRGTRVDVPSRIPIALLPESEVSPVSRNEHFALAEHLVKGDVTTTGDAVLAEPKVDKDRGLVELLLTGGFDGHWVWVPIGLPIALASEAEKLVLAPLLKEKEMPADRPV